MINVNTHDQQSSASPEGDGNPNNCESRDNNPTDMQSPADHPEEKRQRYSPKKYTSATVAAQRAKITVLTMLAIWALFSHFTISLQSLLSW